MDELLQALDMAAEAGTDSLIDESDIKAWFVKQAVELMTHEQRRELAKRFEKGLTEGEGPLAMVFDQHTRDALSILEPLLTR